MNTYVKASKKWWKYKQRKTKIVTLQAIKCKEQVKYAWCALSIFFYLSEKVWTLPSRGALKRCLTFDGQLAAVRKRNK